MSKEVLFNICLKNRHLKTDTPMKKFQYNLKKHNSYLVELNNLPVKSAMI